MSFTVFKFHPQIQTALDQCGYVTPTPVQEQAIPPALEGRTIDEVLAPRPDASKADAPEPAPATEREDTVEVKTVLGGPKDKDCGDLGQGFRAAPVQSGNPVPSGSEGQPGNEEQP